MQSILLLETLAPLQSINFYVILGRENALLYIKTLSLSYLPFLSETVVFPTPSLGTDKWSAEWHH